MKEFARHQSARRGRSFYGAEKLDLARPGPAHTRLASGPDGWREAVREQFSRVGIYAHSGGGFASARAILLYPDFYKVAVSSAGNHDQRGNNAGWGEKYLGLLDGDNYDDQINAKLASNLVGKLLLKNSGSAGLRVPGGPTETPDSLLSEDKADRSPKAPNRWNRCFWILQGGSLYTMSMQSP